MTVDHMHNVLRHLSGDLSLCHLAESTDRQIVSEQRVGCRIAFCSAALDAAFHTLTQPSCHHALCPVELAHRIQNCQLSLGRIHRQGSSQQSGKLLVRHIRHLGAAVGRQNQLRNRCVSAEYPNGSRQLDIGHRSRHHHIVIGSFHFKLSGLRIEIAESFVVQRDHHLTALPRLQEYLTECLQLLFGAEHLTVSAGDIYLRHLGAVIVAGIGQGKGHAAAVCCQIGIGKCSITLAVTEGIPHRHTCRVIIPVANIQTLTVLGGLAGTGVIPVAGRILQFQRPCLRQLAGGIHSAHQRVCHGDGSGLTAQIPVDSGTKTVLGHFKGRTAGKHQHDVGIFRRHRLQKLQMGLGQAHILPVHALAFGGLVQTDTQQHHIRLLGGFHRLPEQLFVDAILASDITGGIAEVLQRLFRKTILQADHGGGIDHRGACTLIAGFFRKSTDQRHLHPRLQGQDAVIFQQHDGFGSTFRRQIMMGLMIVDLGGAGHRAAGFKDHRKQFS